MDKTLDLNRKLCFHQGGFTDADAADAFAKLEHGAGKEQTWADALKHRVVLLVGQANTGKTTELSLLCKRLHAEGKQAFQFRLRDLYEAGRDGQEEVLKNSLLDELEAWRNGDEDAVFLLDSVDEADLIHEHAFLTCVKRVAQLVRSGNLGRARWVVSTRPSAWSSTRVIETICEELCPAVVRLTSDTESSTTSSVATKTSEREVLDVVLCALRPLNARDAETLLRDVFGVSMDARTKSLAENLGLSFATSSPGNLKWLARVLKSSEVPDSRQKAYELAVRELANPRNGERNGSADELLRELKALSAAGVLCDSWMFSFRDADSVAGSLPLSELLSHRDFAFEKLIRAVPLTSDAGFQVVKFVPAHLQVYLAAQWLCDRAQTPADQQALALLFVRESLAGALIPTHLMACAGWMSNRLPVFRERLVELAPHVVLFLGDMAEIPCEEGKLALERTMQLLRRGHPLFSNRLTLTGDDYWHIGRPELHPALCCAFQQYVDDEHCIRYLLYVMSCRKIAGAAPLLRKFLETKRSGRLLRLCVEALETCGDLKDLEWAASQLKTAEADDSGASRVLACALIRRGGSTESVVALCRSLRTDGFSVKHYLADAASEASVAKSIEYAEALLASEEDEGASPDLEDGLDDDELAPAALATAMAVVRGILLKSTLEFSQLQSVVKVLERIRNLPSEREGHRRFSDLLEDAAKHPGFKRLALEVLSRALPEGHVYKLFGDEGYAYVCLSLNDLEMVLEVQRGATHAAQIALLARVREYLEPRRAPEGTAPTGPRRSNDASKAAEETFAVELATRLDELSGGKDVSLLLRAFRLVGIRLVEPLPLKRWDEATDKFGDVLIDALKQGAKALWRDQGPLFDEVNPQSVYYQTMAGLQGLHLELVLEGKIGGVTEDEAARAFDYSLHTLNSAPQWMAELANRWPKAFSLFCERTLSRWGENAAETELATKLVERISKAEDIPAPTEVVLDVIWKMLEGGAWDEASYGQARAVEGLSRFDTMRKAELRSFVSSRAKTAWEGRHSDSFSWWFTQWLRTASNDAATWLATQSEKPGSPKELLHSLGYDFVRTGKSDFVLEEMSESEQCALLSRLYLVYVAAAPHAEDVHYVGVHSPTKRDEAGRFRDSLLSLIAAVGGVAAFEALYSLATRHDVQEPEMRWMHSLALTVADVAAKGPAWTVREFREYARSVDMANLPLRDGENFWKAVQLDVAEVVRNLKDGDFSPRQLLLDTDERGMQLWLARELQLLSLGMYQVHRERELANATTPDLTAQAAGPAKVTLELKLGDGRSQTSLLSDLEQQLHDDYLSDKDAVYGMFVVMWKALEDTVAQAALDRKIGRVQRALESRAEELRDASLGRKHLKVVCFQCPLPISKRNLKLKRKKKTS